jgi:hypothetical protein
MGVAENKWTVYGTSPLIHSTGENPKWRKGQWLLIETAFFKSLAVDSGCLLAPLS